MNRASFELSPFSDKQFSDEGEGAEQFRRVKLGFQADNRAAFFAPTLAHSL